MRRRRGPQYLWSSPPEYVKKYARTMDARTADRVLKTLLRLMGLAELAALGAVFMPEGWMALGHARLGLGQFPSAPIAPYLARCLSAFYAFHGGLLWVLSADVRRYAAPLAYVAWAGIPFAVLVTVLDLRLGFPWYWTIAEGPFAILLSVAFLLLLRVMRQAQAGPG